MSTPSSPAEAFEKLNPEFQAAVKNLQSEWFEAIRTELAMRIVVELVGKGAGAHYAIDTAFKTADLFMQALKDQNFS